MFLTSVLSPPPFSSFIESCVTGCDEEVLCTVRLPSSRPETRNVSLILRVRQVTPEE